MKNYTCWIYGNYIYHYHPLSTRFSKFITINLPFEYMYLPLSTIIYHYLTILNHVGRWVYHGLSTNRQPGRVRGPAGSRRWEAGVYQHGPWAREGALDAFQKKNRTVGFFRIEFFKFRMIRFGCSRI